MSTQKPPSTKGAQTFALIVTAGIAIWFMTCLFGGKSKTPDTNNPATPTEVVFNDPETHSVKQVEDWLYHNLKDYSTYENISYGKVQKLGRSDVIEVRKPKVGCKFYDDAAHTQPDEISPFQKDDIPTTTLYVIADDGQWITFRFGADATTRDNRGEHPSQNYYCKKTQTVETGTKVNLNDAYSVLYKYRAKNSFGAYEITEQCFYFDKAGNITHVEDFGQ